MQAQAGLTQYHATSAISDGTNGTPRTSSETRPTNVAKYAFIRFSSSPTLLALPVSKDNNKTYDSAQVTVLSGGTGWSTSFSKFYPYRTISKTTGLPIWRLAFNVQGSLSVGATNNTLYFSGVTFAANPNQAVSGSGGGATSVIGAVNPNGSSLTLYANTSITNWMVSGDVELALKPTWADEWVEPGTFVGNVPLDWQYDLTVTGSGWTTNRAVGVVYKCGGGQYRMGFNIKGTVTSATRTSYTIAISNVIFNIAAGLQSVSCIDNNPVAQVVGAYGGTGNITTFHASSTVIYYCFSGDVELESKPSFAVNTI